MFVLVWNYSDKNMTMNQVHFASMEDEDDDMYSGFNDFTATDITQVTSVSLWVSE